VTTTPTQDVLAREIADCFPDWGASGLSTVASGLEATVYRVETRRHGPVAVKVFAERTIHNDNDRDLDARELLRQDSVLFEHLLAHGLPAPRVIALHFGASIDFFAYSFVETDGHGCSAREIGGLVRHLHRTPLPPCLPIAHRGNQRFEPVAAELIHARTGVVRRKAGGALPEIDTTEVEASLDAVRGPRALLHMDVRPANILCRGGRVEAWIDWSNAIAAHPVFEMARIAEYGLDYDEVIAGYGDDPLASVAPATATAARIYTAAMLAVVHLSEAPDPARASAAVARLRALMEQFGREVR
jgi:hypothetical protein